MAKNKKKNKNKKKRMTNKKLRIKENYSFKEMEMTLEGTKELQKIYNLVKLGGYDYPIFDEAFNSFEDAHRQFNKIKNIPDRFNHFFSKKGWIAFESLSLDLMEKCVKLAEAGRPKDAEDALLEYFTDRDKISFLVKQLMNIKEFWPRRTLMFNALEDHFNGRYYASVPLFLMLIDGFVNDVERIGFFAEKVELDVWDTIAAHSSGLSAIQKIFNRSRKKTTDEEIYLPYRNGILHGRDLGYANVYVSSKALSTLLALRDWAIEIKNGKKGVNKEFSPPTFEETVEQIASSSNNLKENKRQTEFSKTWKSRDIKVGKDIPAKGKLDEYEEDTPEKAVMQLLEYISIRNYGKLANMLECSRGNEPPGKLPGMLREIFKGKKLVDYKLVNISDIAVAVSEIETELIFEIEEDGKQIVDNRKFRLIYQDEERNIVPRGYKKAEWKCVFNFQDLENIVYV